MNDNIKERLKEKGYMDEEVLRNAVERLERREESRWLIHIFSELMQGVHPSPPSPWKSF